MSINQDLSIAHRDTAHLLMSVNYFGIVNFGNILLPYFKKKGKGYFIGVSSLADVRGFESSGLYCSTKVAVTRYLEAARSEMTQYGVRVMTIKPGFVDTNMTKKNKHKMPFIMSVESAAKRIKKAIDKEKLHYSFPWQTQLSAYLLEAMPDGLYDLLSKMRSKIGQ